ncbi:MAG: ISL3 family transposase [Vicinamibacterales bacterium]
MSVDPTRMCELLVGLHDVNVLSVVENEGRLTVVIEQPQRLTACRACGSVATVKDRDRLELGDLPAFGQPVTLVWVKRRWSCPAVLCPTGSWTEQDPRIAASRCRLTRRAGLWATRQVGEHGRAISAVAGEISVGWHAVQSALEVYGTPLIDDPARTADVSMIGVDETGFLKAKPKVATRFVSAVVDIARPRVLDLFEGRHAPQLDQWLADQPAAWKAGIEVTVCDLHEPFRRALRKHFPDAITVADPFHVVGVATRALDKVRRRVQNETLGHRGRTADPLYRARKLLTKAAERLDEHGTAKLRGLLAAGDPDGHVHAAWLAKECVRDLYTLAADPDVAADWLDGVIEDCATAKPAELRSMGGTLKRWQDQILNWHITGASNGPTEALNLLIKKIKRVGHGFRNFDNYRLRVLLYTGGCNWNLLGH